MPGIYMVCGYIYIILYNKRQVPCSHFNLQCRKGAISGPRLSVREVVEVEELGGGGKEHHDHEMQMRDARVRLSAGLKVLRSEEIELQVYTKYEVYSTYKYIHAVCVYNRNLYVYIYILYIIFMQLFQRSILYRILHVLYGFLYTAAIRSH